MVPTCLRLRQGSISQRRGIIAAKQLFSSIIKLFTSFGWACHIKKCLKQRIVAGGRQRARCDTSSLTLLRARTGSLVETQSSSLHVHINAKYHLMVLIFIYNAKKKHVLHIFSQHNIIPQMQGGHLLVHTTRPKAHFHEILRIYTHKGHTKFRNFFNSFSIFFIFRHISPGRPP